MPRAQRELLLLQLRHVAKVSGLSFPREAAVRLNIGDEIVLLVRLWKCYQFPGINTRDERATIKSGRGGNDVRSSDRTVTDCITPGREVIDEGRAFFTVWRVGPRGHEYNIQFCEVHVIISIDWRYKTSQN